MAKGALAKTFVANKISAAFGTDFIGEYDKKYYVWGMENGEKVQIAISLTCPKNPVSITTTSEIPLGDFDFESMDTVRPVSNTPADITPEETEKVNDLLKKLGF